MITSVGKKKKSPGWSWWSLVGPDWRLAGAWWVPGSWLARNDQPWSVPPGSTSSTWQFPVFPTSRHAVLEKDSDVHHTERVLKPRLVRRLAHGAQICAEPAPWLAADGLNSSTMENAFRRLQLLFHGIRRLGAPTPGLSSLR
jgi:hypothetical protein